MSEQTTTTPQVDEVKPVETTVNGQVDAEVKSDEVSNTEKVVDNGKVEAEKVTEHEKDESASAVSTTEHVASSDDKVVEKPEEKKSAEAEEKPAEEQSKEVPQEGTEQQVEQPAVAEVNGKHSNEDAQDKKSTDEMAAAPVDETNGVCKRKTENGAEAVEDEKTPKKAKVVSDGDQAPVEETAA